MKLLDVSLVDAPLKADQFTFLNDNDYPFVLLGYQIKNLYDQERFKFNKQFKCVDVAHCTPCEEKLPRFFRGIKLELKKDFYSLLDRLDILSVQDDKLLSVYKNILSEFNLTCNNCFAYLKKNIYPVDSECLKDIALSNHDINFYYENLLDTKNVALYQSLGYLVIYILNNKKVSKFETKNIF